VFYRRVKNASGDQLRFIRNVRTMDNEISHEFDLQMFLTVNDSFSDNSWYFTTDVKSQKGWKSYLFYFEKTSQEKEK